MFFSATTDCFLNRLQLSRGKPDYFQEILCIIMLKQLIIQTSSYFQDKVQ